ncbi:MAG: hypothetical protein KA059_02985 [Elusimicrobiales bacterium]|nr:hypothetical protein [Elusimicrobiales bacterium]
MNKAIDKDIYAPEALEIARNIIDKDNKINIIKKGDDIFISTDDEMLFKRFMNEALHQDLRLSLTKKNFNIIRLITTKAIASAIGKRGKIVKKNNKKGK